MADINALRDALETVVRQCGDRLTKASGNTALLPHIQALLAEPMSTAAERKAALYRRALQLACDGDDDKVACFVSEAGAAHEAGEPVQHGGQQ